MPFLFYAPILSISALTGQRIARLFPLIDMVFEEAQRRVSTAQLNEFLKDVTEKHQAPMHHGKFVKFSFMVQSLIQPPTFLCFANYPSGVTRDYKRYLEHQLRKRFGFYGTPIRLFLRKK
jgi:GTP-binding protein